MSKPSVLFVCVHNAGRSQMAAAFLTHLSDGAVEVRSAGSEPADQINPAAVQAMAEAGIDITAEKPKILTDQAVRAVRRGDHDGLRRHLPVLPRQTLRGLGPRRPGRPRGRGGPTDPRRDPPSGRGAHRRTCLWSASKGRCRQPSGPAPTTTAGRSIIALPPRIENNQCDDSSHRSTDVNTNGTMDSCRPPRSHCSPSIWRPAAPR